MSVHEIDLPFKIVVGNNVTSDIVKYIENLGFDKRARVGVVTGETTYKVVGSKVEESLVNEGYSVETWKIDRSSVEVAEKIVEEARAKDVKVLFGVGGGKAIDVAKYVAHRVNGEVVSVPTAASHDGIASPFASLSGLSKPMSIPTKTPRAIIADIDVIARAPARLLRSGVGDLLGKLVAVRDWRLAHKLRGEYYGEYAAQLALMSAKHVMRYFKLISLNSVEGVRVVVEALISSGVAMCIAGSSRPASGSEHLFSHALELLAPGVALHGERVALGTIIMLYLYGGSLWKRVKSMMKKVGLPTTAREMGVEPEILVRALTIAHSLRPERYTILGDRGLSERAALAVLRETGIID